MYRLGSVRDTTKSKSAIIASAIFQSGPLRKWNPRRRRTPGATIGLAAEVAATLADLPAEPQAIDAIREVMR